MFSRFGDVYLLNLYSSIINGLWICWSIVLCCFKKLIYSRTRYIAKHIRIHSFSLLQCLLFANTPNYAQLPPSAVTIPPDISLDVEVLSRTTASNLILNVSSNRYSLDLAKSILRSIACIIPVGLFLSDFGLKDHKQHAAVNQYLLDVIK